MTNAKVYHGVTMTKRFKSTNLSFSNEVMETFGFRSVETCK